MKTIDLPEFRVALPDWIESFLPEPDHVYSSDEEKMNLAIRLAGENIRHDSGGPFGAAVFDKNTGKLIAPGVNVVVPSQWSGGHAEVMALAWAQMKLKTHDLGANGMPYCELFTSTEPCVMCLGASIWSGVRRVVCASRDEDARGCGFDEGPKPGNWRSELESRGIEVTQDILREKAVDVLNEYVRLGKPVYNARQNKLK
ncbi:nucleoside deaminase [Balneolaceae bacterium ANBcel3]|nr:nucleoside deaminase [Balneolaceae bacterium ANBcel3]